MGDWSLPVLGTAYASFLSDINDRLNDTAEMFNSAPSNQPDHTIRLVRSPVKFQEWLAAAWNDLLLDVTGGGTGAATASGARTNLGLGTMSTQNANAVAITGGTIGTAAQVDAATVASVAGSHVAQSALGTGSGGAGTKVLFDDQTYKLVVVSLAWVYLAKSANYIIVTADIQGRTVFLLTNTITITLPATTTAGNDGLDIPCVNKGTGIITFNAHAGDTILGASSYTFDFGQYSSITFRCNAASNSWEIF